MPALSLSVSTTAPWTALSPRGLPSCVSWCRGALSIQPGTDQLTSVVLRLRQSGTEEEADIMAWEAVISCESRLNEMIEAGGLDHDTIDM